MRPASVILLVVLLLAAAATVDEPEAEDPYRRLELPLVRLAPEESILRLALVGDLHGVGGARTAAALRLLHERTPLDAVLLLGDNFEDGVRNVSDERWELLEPLTALELPIFPVLGNHDYGNPKKRWRIRRDTSANPQAQVERSRLDRNWRFPARNYVIDTPVARMFMIDSTPLAMDLERPLAGSLTASQIKSAIRERLSSSDGRWQIVAGHHNTDHSGVRRIKAAGTRANMAAFGSMLKAGGADLYISGHQHHLELLAADAERPASIISGATGRPKKASSLSRRDPSTLFLATVPPDSCGFAVLEIEENEMRVTFHERPGHLPGGRTFHFKRSRNDGSSRRGQPADH